MIYTHDCLDLDRVHGYTGISLTVTTDLMMVKAIARDSHYIKSYGIVHIVSGQRDRLL